MTDEKSPPGTNPGAPVPPRRVLHTPGGPVVIGGPGIVTAKTLKKKTSPAFLPKDDDDDYVDYIAAPTKGLVTPLIIGRNSNGADLDKDLNEPLDEMENRVRFLTAGDFVYLAAWFFGPNTPLTTGFASPGITNWGELFVDRAKAGVLIRILVNDFDPISGMDQWLQDTNLDPLTALINGMPEDKRDNLKFVVTLHPAHVGKLKTMLSGQSAPKIHVASHHQKFMVTRKGDELVAFCGGVDIEKRKAFQNWSYAGLAGWHDVHFKLQGPIAYDLEREFVLRWNREKGVSPKTPAITGWKPFTDLTRTAIAATDQTPAKQVHKVQMLRTVSEDATLSAFSTERDDILKVYLNVIHASETYLYLENQYFRDQKVADALVGRAKANAKLIIVLVVVNNAAADDGDNAVTKHGDYLQHLFFKKVFDAFGARSGFFTMTNRAVHSKLMIADDQFIVGGSANCNARSFALDSELNISVDDKPLTLAFRKRLWAHNLGESEAAVADASKMISLFQKAAATNAPLDLPAMVGEGIADYDFKKNLGTKSSLISDEFAYMDFDDRMKRRGEGLRPDLEEGNNVAVVANA